MGDIKRRLRLIFKRLRLSEYYYLIKLIKILGSHRYLSVSRVFISSAVLVTVRVLVLFKLFRRPLNKIFIKQQQILIRHPNLVVNPYNLELQQLRVCITYHCNRNCSFCYSRGLQEEFKEHMSLSDFEFLIRWAKSQGWQSLRLLGGEPTVHPEFKTILGIARQQGFSLSISTNGLFDPELNSSFNNCLIEYINFSYPQDQLEPQDMEIFQQNLKKVISKKIPVVLSGIIYPDKDDWRQIIDLAKRYPTKAIVRFSMVLPGHQKHFSPKEFQDHIHDLAKQILHISRYAYKNCVAFYFYRPLLLCMFSPEEIKFLRSISPFLCYSRCPLCLKGNYDVDLRLTVNPDLSCFPCPVLLSKGIKITPEMTRETINQFFKPLIKQLSMQPLMDTCQTCQYFINYKRHLEDASQDLADRTVCQGGCFEYRA